MKPANQKIKTESQGARALSCDANSLFVWLDEPYVLGKMPGAMHGSISVVTRSALWHPNDSAERINSVCLKGQRYSGDLVLIGHGFPGKVATVYDGKGLSIPGRMLIDLLFHKLPEDIRLKTSRIFFLQCSAATPGKDPRCGGSVVDDATEEIKKNFASWPNVEMICANHFVTHYELNRIVFNNNASDPKKRVVITNKEGLVDPSKYSFKWLRMSAK